MLCTNRENNIIELQHRQSLFEEINDNIKVAKFFGCKHLLLLAQPILSNGQAASFRNSMNREKLLLNMCDGLKSISEIGEKENIVFNLEILNSKTDHPGYFIDNSQVAFELIKAANSPYIKILFDIYHVQITEGNIISTIEKNIDYIRHIHYVDVPG